MRGKIIAPIKNNKIPSLAQWLGGIGAGSWFCLEKKDKNYQISRFSEDGDLECSGIFTTEKKGFEINLEYQFTYLSHCQQCTIIQNRTKYKFKLIENDN